MSNIQKKQKKMGLSKSERKAKKNKRRQYVIGIILVFLMVVSGAGILVGGTGTNANTYEYQDYKFKLEEIPELGNQLAFTTEFDDGDVYFYNLPQDAIRVATQGNLTPVIGVSPVIGVASDPISRLAPAYDLIAFDLALLSGKQIYTTATVQREGFEQLIVYDCTNATQENTPLIIFDEADVNASTQIRVEGPCVFVDLHEADITRVRDRLLFTMRGVINTR